MLSTVVLWVVCLLWSQKHASFDLILSYSGVWYHLSTRLDKYVDSKISNASAVSVFRQMVSPINCYPSTRLHDVTSQKPVWSSYLSMWEPQMFSFRYSSLEFTDWNFRPVPTQNYYLKSLILPIFRRAPCVGDRSIARPLLIRMIQTWNEHRHTLKSRLGFELTIPVF
jgi:hypothetical protein